MSDDSTKITVAKNGPYLVQGPVTVSDNAGNTWDTDPGKPVALCRCGLSGNKPFCDGTHGKQGFEDAASPA